MAAHDGSTGGHAGGLGGGHGGGGSVQLPEGLQKFFKITCGMTWPEGNENGLWAMATAWKNFAAEMDHRADEIEALVPRVADAMHGVTADLHKKFLTEKVKQIRGAADSAKEFSTMCQNTGADIQKGKIMMIVMALMFLATIISLAASLFGAPLIPEVVEACKAGIRALWSLIVSKIRQVTMAKAASFAAQIVWNAGKYAAGGAAFMAGLDLTIQGFQRIDAADGEGGRSEIDWDSVGSSAAGGAIGGAGFGGVHGAGKFLGKGGGGAKGPGGKAGAGGKEGHGGPGGPGGPGGKEGLFGKEGPVGKEGPGGKEGSAGKEGPGGKEGSTGKEGASGKEGSGGEKNLSGEKAGPPEHGSGSEKGSSEGKGPGKEEGGAEGKGSSKEEGPSGKGAKEDRPSVVTQLTYAGAQAGMVAATNPLVNLATGGHDEAWTGMLGGASSYHSSKGWSAKLDGTAERIAKGIGGKFGLDFDQPTAGAPVPGEHQSGSERDSGNNKDGHADSSQKNESTGKQPSIDTTAEGPHHESQEKAQSPETDAHGKTGGQDGTTTEHKPEQHQSQENGQQRETHDNQSQKQEPVAGSQPKAPESADPGTRAEAPAAHGETPQGGPVTQPAAPQGTTQQGAPAAAQPATPRPGSQQPAGPGPVQQGPSQTPAPPANQAPQPSTSTPGPRQSGPAAAQPSSPQPMTSTPGPKHVAAPAPAPVAQSSTGPQPGTQSQPGGEGPGSRPAPSRQDSPVSQRENPVPPDPAPPAEKPRPKLSIDTTVSRRSDEPVSPLTGDDAGKGPARPVSPMSPDRPAPPSPDKPVVDKALSEKPLPEKQLPDRPVPDKLVVDKPLPDRPMADKPVADKPLPDRPAPDRPQVQSTEKPGAKADRSRQEDAAAAVFAQAYLGPGHQPAGHDSAPNHAHHDSPNPAAQGFFDSGDSVLAEQWKQRREAAKPTRVGMERFESLANDRFSSENGKLSGKITQIRFDIRHFEVKHPETGQVKAVVEVTVPYDFVSPDGSVSAADRKDVGTKLQEELDKHFNHRYRWEDEPKQRSQFAGSQLHFRVDVDTPDGIAPGWDRKPEKSLPVEIHDSRKGGGVGGPAVPKTNQQQWNVGRPDHVKEILHENFHSLGLADPADANLRFKRDAPLHGGIMGGEGSNGKPLELKKDLTGGQLAQIRELIGNAGPVRFQSADDPSVHTPAKPDPGVPGDLVKSIYTDGPYDSQHNPPNAPPKSFLDVLDDAKAKNEGDFRAAHDEEDLRHHISEAIDAGRADKARVLLNRLKPFEDLHRDLSEHYQEQVAAKDDGAKVDVPKHLHFVWFGDTPPRGEVDNLVAWGQKVGETDGQWKATLWTNESADKWNPSARKEITDAGIKIDKNSRAAVKELSRDMKSPTPDDIFEKAMSGWSNLRPKKKAFNMASDIVRYAVLHKDGGVYADADIRPGSLSLGDVGDMRVRPDEVPLLGPRLRDEGSVREQLGIDGNAKVRKEHIAAAAEQRYESGVLGNHFIVAPPRAEFIKAFAETVPGKYESLKEKHPDGKKIDRKLTKWAPDISGPNVLDDHPVFDPTTSLITRYTTGKFGEGTPIVMRPDFHALFDPDIKAKWSDLEWISPASENQLDRVTGEGSGAKPDGTQADGQHHGTDTALPRKGWMRFVPEINKPRHDGDTAGRITNCAALVINVYNSMKSGKLHQADPSGRVPTEQVEKVAGAKFSGNKSLREIREAMAGARPGTHAFVFVKRGEDGHYFNVHKDSDGAVYAIDAQQERKVDQIRPFGDRLVDRWVSGADKIGVLTVPGGTQHIEPVHTPITADHREGGTGVAQSRARGAGLVKGPDDPKLSYEEKNFVSKEAFTEEQREQLAGQGAVGLKVDKSLKNATFRNAIVHTLGEGGNTPALHQRIERKLAGIRSDDLGEISAKAGVRAHVLRKDGSWDSYGPIDGVPVHVVRSDRKYFGTAESVHIGREGVGYPTSAKYFKSDEMNADPGNREYHLEHRGESEIETIKGEHYVRVYTAVYDVAEPGSEHKDVHQEPGGRIVASTGSGKTMFLSGGRPLRAVQWIAKYQNEQAAKHETAKTPLLRSYLVPLGEFNEISKHARAEAVQSREDGTLNVDQNGDVNQFGVRGDDLDSLRRNALPGSMVTYVPKGSENHRLTERSGRLEELSDLHTRLGIPPDFDSTALGHENDPWFEWTRDRNGEWQFQGFRNDAGEQKTIAERLTTAHALWTNPENSGKGAALLDPDYTALPGQKGKTREIPVPGDEDFHRFLNTYGPTGKNVGKVGQVLDDVVSRATAEVVRQQPPRVNPGEVRNGIVKSLNTLPDAFKVRSTQLLRPAGPAGKDGQRPFAPGNLGELIDTTLRHDELRAGFVRQLSNEMADAVVADDRFTSLDKPAFDGKVRDAVRERIAEHLERHLNELRTDQDKAKALDDAGRQNQREWLAGDRMKKILTEVVGDVAKDPALSTAVRDAAPSTTPEGLAAAVLGSAMGNVRKDTIDGVRTQDLVGRSPDEQRRLFTDEISDKVAGSVAKRLKGSEAFKYLNPADRDRLAGEIARRVEHEVRTAVRGVDLPVVERPEVAAFMEKVPGIATQARIGETIAADAARTRVDFDAKSLNSETSGPYVSKPGELRDGQEPGYDRYFPAGQFERQRGFGDRLDRVIGAELEREETRPNAAKEIVERLVGEFPGLKRKFDEVIKAEQGSQRYRADGKTAPYTYGEHAQMVVNQYLELARADRDGGPRFVSHEAVVKAILFHDMDKLNSKNQFGDAQVRHDREGEHLGAVRYLNEHQGLWSNHRDLIIARALVDSDPIGSYLRARPAAREAARNAAYEYIKKVAEEVGTPDGRKPSAEDVRRFFSEFVQYYQSDFSSYSSESKYVGDDGKVRSGRNELRHVLSREGENGPFRIEETEHGTRFAWDTTDDKQSAASKMDELQDLFDDRVQGVGGAAGRAVLERIPENPDREQDARTAVEGADAAREHAETSSAKAWVAHSRAEHRLALSLGTRNDALGAVFGTTEAKDRAEAEVQEARAWHDDMTRQRDRYAENGGELAGRRPELADNVAAAREELETARLEDPRAAQAAEKKVRFWRERLNTLDAVIAENSASLAAANSTMDRARHRLSTAEADVTGTRASAAAATESLAKVETAIVTAEQAKHSAFVALEHSKVDRQAAADAANASHEAGAGVPAAVQNVRSADTRVTDLTTEAANQHRQTEDLKAARHQITRQIAAVERRHQAVERRIDALPEGEENPALVAERDNLAQERRDLGTRRDDHDRRIVQAESLAEELDEQVGRAEEARNAAVRRLDDVVEQVNSHSQDARDAENAAATSREQAEKALADVGKAGDEAKDAAAQGRVERGLGLSEPPVEIETLGSLDPLTDVLTALTGQDRGAVHAELTALDRDSLAAALNEGVLRIGKTDVALRTGLERPADTRTAPPHRQPAATKKETAAENAAPLSTATSGSMPFRAPLLIVSPIDAASGVIRPVVFAGATVRRAQKFDTTTTLSESSGYGSGDSERKAHLPTTMVITAAVAGREPMTTRIQAGLRMPDITPGALDPVPVPPGAAAVLKPAPVSLPTGFTAHLGGSPDALKALGDLLLTDRPGPVRVDVNGTHQVITPEGQPSLTYLGHTRTDTTKTTTHATGSALTRGSDATFGAGVYAGVKGGYAGAFVDLSSGLTDGNNPGTESASAHTSTDTDLIYRVDRSMRIGDAAGEVVSSTVQVSRWAARELGLPVPEFLRGEAGPAPENRVRNYPLGRDDIKTVDTDRIVPEVSAGLGDVGRAAVAAKFDTPLKARDAIYNAVHGGTRAEWNQDGRRHFAAIHAEAIPPVSTFPSGQLSASVEDKHTEQFRRLFDVKRSGRAGFGGAYQPTGTDHASTGDAGPTSSRGAPNIGVGGTWERGYAGKTGYTGKSARSSKYEGGIDGYDGGLRFVVEHWSTTSPGWARQLFLGGRMTLGPEAADRLTGPAREDVEQARANSPHIHVARVDNAITASRPSDKQSWASKPPPPSDMTPGVYLSGAPEIASRRVIGPRWLGEYTTIEDVVVTPGMVEGAHIGLAKRVEPVTDGTVTRKPPMGSGNWPTHGQREFTDGTGAGYRYKNSELTRPGTASGEAVHNLFGRAGSRGVAGQALDGRASTTGKLHESGRLQDYNGDLRVDVEFSSPRLLHVGAEDSVAKHNEAGESLASGTKSHAHGVDAGVNLSVDPKRDGSAGALLRAYFGGWWKRGGSHAEEMTVGGKHTSERKAPMAYVQVDVRYRYTAEMNLRNVLKTSPFTPLPVTVDTPNGAVLKLPVEHAADLFTRLGQDVAPELAAALPDPKAPVADPVQTLLPGEGEYGSYGRTTVVGSQLTSGLGDLDAAFDRLGVDSQKTRAQARHQITTLLSTPDGHEWQRDVLLGDQGRGGLIVVSDSGVTAEDALVVKVTAKAADGEPDPSPALPLPPDKQTTAGYVSSANQRKANVSHSIGAVLEAGVSDRKKGGPSGTAVPQILGGSRAVKSERVLPGSHSEKVTTQVGTKPVGRSRHKVVYELELSRGRAPMPLVDTTTLGLAKLFDWDKSEVAEVSLPGTVDLVSPGAGSVSALRMPGQDPVIEVVPERPARDRMFGPRDAYAVVAIGAKTAAAIHDAAYAQMSDKPLQPGRPVDGATLAEAIASTSDYTRSGSAAEYTLHNGIKGSALDNGSHAIFTGDSYRIAKFPARKHTWYESLFDLGVTGEFRPGSFRFVEALPAGTTIDLSHEFETAKPEGDSRTVTRTGGPALSGSGGVSSVSTAPQTGGPVSHDETAAKAGKTSVTTGVSYTGRSYLFTPDAEFHLGTRKYGSNSSERVFTSMRDWAKGQPHRPESVVRIRSSQDLQVRVWENTALDKGLLTIADVWTHAGKTPPAGLSVVSSPYGAIVYRTGGPVPAPVAPGPGSPRGRNLQLGEGVSQAEVDAFVAGLPADMRPVTQTGGSRGQLRQNPDLAVRAAVPVPAGGFWTDDVFEAPGRH